MLKENDSLVQVKICGLTSMDDVHIIEKYGADYAGMVLYYPKSRRNIDITLAETLATRLKKSDIKTVAVVVSPDVSQLEAIQNAGFDYIQIHGELSDDVYNACSVRIIRAVNIKHQSEEDIYLETKRWQSLDKIYGLLFDAGVPGSGKTFDWESLKFSYQRSAPAAFLRLNGNRRLNVIFKSGKVTAIEESRIVCAILVVPDKVRPISGKLRE